MAIPSPALGGTVKKVKGVLGMEPESPTDSESGLVEDNFSNINSGGKHLRILIVQPNDRIFGLFNKLNANSEGRSIGLTLIKGIIEIYGGHDLSSEQNEK
jgi:hypothetical protein